MPHARASHMDDNAKYQSQSNIVHKYLTIIYGQIADADTNVFY